MRILRAMAAAAVAVSMLATIPASGSERARSRTAAERLPALTAARADSLTRALKSGELSEAEYALERARSIFDLSSVRSRFGAVTRPGGRDATLILRDLAIRAKDLSGDDRTEAESLLARPDDPFGDAYGQPYKRKADITKTCAATGIRICVHYVAPGDGDRFNRTRVAWATKTLNEMSNVWTREITDLGFRRPRGDNSSNNNGGDKRTDVYLANIGSAGVYGYCNTDDPAIFQANGRHDVSAYCVLDNDYSHDEFPNLGPLENMQVTAAHEFFHAIQFAYDAYDDSWFLEGTAAWMEDEVYDAVNDNYQYLESSPATQPDKPLDFTNNGDGFMNRYGTWYFWRFMSESFSSVPLTSDPSVIRRIWELADAAGSAPDLYSLEATEAVVIQEGRTFGDLFTEFAGVAYVPESFFEEGLGYLSFLGSGPGDGRPPLSLDQTLTSGVPEAESTGSLDHLSSAYFSFSPGAINETSQLLIEIDAPQTTRGSRASLVVRHINGSSDVTEITLDPDGAGSVSVPFGPSTVDSVVVVTSNASTEYTNCGGNTFFSCGGKPKYDNQDFTVKGSLQ